MRLLTGVLLTVIATTSVSWAADNNPGKTVAQSKCVSCHQPADWQGETERGLSALIRDVASGKVKHSKFQVQLSEAEIADLTAYWLSGKK